MSRTPGGGAGGGGASERYDLQLKLLLIGDSGVGKSCLLQRYVDGGFTRSFIATIGIDFKIKHVKVADTDGNTHAVKLQIWDTAGQERFRNLTTSYFRGAHGIALCFDLTDRRSLASVEVWTEQVKKLADDDVAVVLVANKADAVDKHQVTKEEAAGVAERYKLPLFFCSALKSDGVDAPFEVLAKAGLKAALAAKPAGAGSGGGGAAAGDTIRPGKETAPAGGASGCAC